MRRLSIPILAQITIPYVVVAVLLALLGTFLVTRGVFDTVEERFTNQLLEAGLRADENIVREENNLLETLRLVSNVGSLDAAITSRQPATVETLVLPIAYNSNLGCFAILGLNGESLTAQWFNPETQLYEPLQYSQPLDQLPFILSVLSGQVDALGDKFAGFAATDHGNMLLFAGPVKDGVGNQVGVAVVGISAENLAEIIRLQTLAHTSFYGLGGEPLVSTLDSAPVIESDIAGQVLERQQEGSYQREIQDTGITYRELLVNLELREGQDIGIMGVAIPTNFISQSSQINRPTTYLMIAAGLGLALLFGFVIAGRITRPIRDLKTAAQRVASGDLRVKIERPGSDEVGLLSQSFNTMVDSLNRSQRALLDTYNKTIEGWARAMDLRDHETEGHSRRVADLSVALAGELGYSGQALAHLRRGALLHDIGKIAIPDSVLLKQGTLTDEERKLMRQHPIYAQSFIGEIEFLKPAMDIPANHHEKWDGSGYPRGLRGEEIPFAARIFAVVDVWDALTSNRPYRKALPPQEVMAYLESESGRHFDPAVVKAFKKLMKL
jgi:HD-GYP domain-containing protein (c-di-GMP phosphodiesterase class II)